ncbi:MAG: DUF3276 family protein [Chitinophagales bacterium]|nr:DUF3276 family protein [Chitinophagales bacterium]
MENKEAMYSGYFSKKLKAGKRRTYFFDVRSTKQGDFFLTITESKKKPDGDGFEMHKIFLYKEDFKKFMEALNETVDYIKQELLPEYNFDAERPTAPRRRRESHRPNKEERPSNDTAIEQTNFSGEEDLSWE